MFKKSHSHKVNPEYIPIAFINRLRTKPTFYLYIFLWNRVLDISAFCMTWWLWVRSHYGSFEFLYYETIVCHIQTHLWTHKWIELNARSALNDLSNLLNVYFALADGRFLKFFFVAWSTSGRSSSSGTADFFPGHTTDEYVISIE